MVTLFRLTTIWFALCVVGFRAVAEDGMVRFDFETGDLQGWQIVEGQFDYIVSDRQFYHNRYPEAPDNKYNKQGKYYLSTVEQQPGKPSKDAMTGVLESPVFVPAGPEMSFLVGGGTMETVYVALCTADGRELVKARGRQTEIMQRVTWNLPELVGQPAFLRIVDHCSGSWGYVAFDDFVARGKIDLEATKTRFAAVVRRRALGELQSRIRDVDLKAMRAAIEDLTHRYPDRYPGAGYLQRLGVLEKQVDRIAAILAEARPTIEKDAEELASSLLTLQREALVANPLVSGQPILFLVRPQYRSSYHAIDTLFHTGEANTRDFVGGGAIKTIDLKTGTTRTLFESAHGLPRDPEVHFDGKRIVFALRRHINEDWHIFEINADGTGMKQLTSAPGVCDFDPLYLPDDSIVFSSTREPKYNMCSQDIAANLHRMDADGANIHQIDRNNLFDNQASLMPDGRILYARWEYVDRNFGDAHSLWTCNPDGTNHAIYWGNNTASPGAAYTARAIPGIDRVVCIFGPHHDHLWGAMAIVDHARAMDGRDAVVHLWPADSIKLVRAGGSFDCDSFSRLRYKYADPYPLSDKYFLCSRMTGRGDQMGIYLVDVFGNEMLLHAEGPGCYDPMPLAARVRPPVMATRRDFTSPKGTFYVQDAYRGTHMQGVKRGSVKSLRVVESPEKRSWSDGRWFGQGYTAPGMNWHSLENKRILGTVPVEEDGSAYFSVPAEKFVYFQLLDENGMMVQSMRSGAFVQPGERAGCVGCHDDRRGTPPETRLPLAMRRAPSDLGGWYGEPRLFSYTREVQPIWDRHCVRCHDYGTEGGGKLNLAPDRDITFATSYIELWRKGYTAGIGAGPAEIQPAYSWGSHVSRLVKTVLKPHYDVKLNREELDRVVTWVDLNSVYYSDYFCAYPDSLTGRCPLDRSQLGRLGQLTGVDFSAQRSFSSSPGAMVSFDRPELSPSLAKFADKSDAKYREALAIIQAGREMLAKRPEADREGFVPCDTDRRRQEKYLMRRQIETRNRAAIAEGKKVYDEGKP